VDIGIDATYSLVRQRRGATVKELLRSHSLSYVQGLQIALEAQGIKSVLLDQQSPGYLGFAGRVRLAVARDADYERAMAIVHALEPPRSGTKPPPSWAWQRSGLRAGALGFVLLIAGAVMADSGLQGVGHVLLGAAIALMVVGWVLIVLGPQRDRKIP